MKKFLLACWSIAALFAFTGCNDDEELVSGDVVHKAGTVYFIADASSQVVTLQNIHTDEFTAWRPDADSWLSLEHFEGNQLVVRVEENFDRVRTSKITVRSGDIIEEIPVYQMEKRSVRFEGVEEVKLRGVGETQLIPLMISNMEAPYRVESDQTWVTAEIIDGNATPEPTPTPDPNEPVVPGEPVTTNQPVVENGYKPVLKLTMEENIPGAGERTATLVVVGNSSSGSEVTFKVTVKQAATYRKSYKFTLPEFTNGTKIFKIMDENGKQIAEVCKEWLGSVNNAAAGVDMSAAVVYLMDENGKSDLSNGYIANVFRINTGEGKPYAYRDPNFNEEIYGGTVVWDKENNSIASYTKGTLKAAPEVIYIPGDNYPVTPEVQPNAVEATATPYIVEDNRPNDTPRVYTVVKVGTQYWFDHNLMAKYYVDGTLIEKGATSTAKEKPFIFFCFRKADDSGNTYTFDSQHEDPYYQEQIEIYLQKYGASYNFLALSKTYVPEGMTYKEYWAPFYDLCYDGYFYDIPESENMLCPEGFMPPNEKEIKLYQSYVEDKTTYLDLGILDTNDKPIEDNKYTRHWRVRDMSQYPDRALANYGFTDENITGLTEVLTTRLSNGSYSIPTGKNLTYTYMLSRTIMPFISGNGSNGSLDEEDPGIVCFTGQNGAFANRWYNMTVGMPVRCIRLD